MSKLFDKLFTYNDWGIAFRPIGADNQLPMRDIVCQYESVRIKRGHYYADPFLFRNERGMYLFAEHMDRKRGIGSIAVAKYEEEQKKFSGFCDVIVEPFHLSYPNTFSHQDSIYMIPESNASGKLLLYRADDFPNHWTVDSVLLEGIKLVDSSLLPRDESSYYLFSHDFEKPDQKILFLLDMQDKSVKRLSDIEADIMVGRGAGNVMNIKTKWVRPVQDCSLSYGARILLFDTQITSECFTETPIGTIEPHNISVSNGREKPLRVHTINRCTGFEVVDYLEKRFYWDKPIRKIVGKMRKNK